MKNPKSEIMFFFLFFIKSQHSHGGPNGLNDSMNVSTNKVGEMEHPILLKCTAFSLIASRSSVIEDESLEH